MTRFRAVLLGLALLLVACTEGPAGRASPVGPSTPRSEVRLPRLVLRADLRSTPARWRLVTRIPFGSGRGRLGLVAAGRHTPVPYVPVSFAVDADGSFWILDVVKKRLAHFARDGAFLGAIGGLRFDRFHAHPYDVAMAAGRPVVLELRPSSLAGVVDVPAGGRFTRTAIHVGPDAVRVVGLLRSGGAPVGWLSGKAMHPGTDPSSTPSGYASLDVPGTGRAGLLPGIPIGDGSYATLEAGRDGSFEAMFVRERERSILPIRIDVFAGDRRIGAVFGARTDTPLRHGFASLIRLAPSNPRDSRRLGDGRWLLALFDDGSPMLWERLPQPRFDDELVVRHLTSGPDDRLYLMQVDPRGVTIFRR